MFSNCNNIHVMNCDNNQMTKYIYTRKYKHEMLVAVIGK